MKQTLETRTNEPILWYSPGYVDFGSFDESINFMNKDSVITFEFEFNLNLRYLEFELLYGLHRKASLNDLDDEEDEEVNYELVTIKLKIVISKEQITKLEIVIFDQIIELFISDENHNVRTLINGELIHNNQDLVGRYIGGYLNMLPRIFTFSGGKFSSLEKHFKDKLFSKISSFAPSTTKDNTIDDAINSIKFGDSEIFLKSLNQIKSSSKKLEKNLQNIKPDDKDYKEIRNYFYGIMLNSLIDICNGKLTSFFSSVRYIAPLRASAERYYRIQGLSLDEIDPQGANIPMLLNNMNGRDKRNFNKWIKENFKFEIIADSDGGHTSLYIKYNDDFKINLADTGFGYSQILPIILVLWQATQQTNDLIRIKRFRGLNKFDIDQTMDFTIVIEQPELHLHPSFQAMLIDTFAKIIKISNENEINVKILIETHSETMINRIGQIIAEQYEGFNKDLVNVLIFNTTNSYESEISSTGYTEEGYLSSWPVGFFSPEEL